MGPPRRGAFWDRWLAAYYARPRARARRRSSGSWRWPDAALRRRARGVRRAAARASRPARRSRRTGDRSAARRRRRGGRADGVAAPAARVRAGRRLPRASCRSRSERAGPDGASSCGAAAGCCRDGGRRAGCWRTTTGPKLIGLAARQHTGWLRGPGCDAPAHRVAASGPRPTRPCCCSATATWRARLERRGGSVRGAAEVARRRRCRCANAAATGGARPRPAPPRAARSARRVGRAAAVAIGLHRSAVLAVGAGRHRRALVEPCRARSAPAIRRRRTATPTQHQLRNSADPRRGRRRAPARARSRGSSYASRHQLMIVPAA